MFANKSSLQPKNEPHIVIRFVSICAKFGICTVFEFKLMGHLLKQK
jgi:hypothetical protein